MKTVFTLIIIFICLSVYSQNQNKAGTLDSSFGVNGKVFTSSSTAYLVCNSATSGPNKSIIVAGDITFAGQPGGFLAMKYFSDGRLDTTFGNNGIGSVIDQGSGRAVAIQADNKIIITGYIAAMFGSYNIITARLNANGTIDSKFGINGVVTAPTGEWANDITVQPDGKIIIVGTDRDKTVMLRYLSDGTPDTNFGTNGEVETYFGRGSATGNAILIQPDGKIIIGGGTNQVILLGRYNSDGSLDETFGNGGEVVYDVGLGVDRVADIALQPDGKIISVGTTSSRNGETINTIILRYLPDGNLDSSFGTNGLTIFKLQKNAELKSVVLQDNGKIIAAGDANDITGNAHFLVERYNSDGTVDSAFGKGGFQITDMDQSDGAKAVILQHDGKIILAGEAINTEISGPSEYEVALARYDGDESQKQIIISKIRYWIQHHNGIEWDYNSNISSYIVQRSYDGIHFNSIARINSNNQSELNYNDASPLSGTNYYRLQTTSINGVINYSNVIAITNDDIKVSPNPATNSLYIEGLSSANKTKLTVVDFSGNIKIQVVANNTSYNLNIASLKAGNYILKIETNDDVVTKNFVKK